MTKIHIDEVYPKGTTYPMLVNFQNGYTTEHFKSQECMLFENTKNGTKSLATVVDGLIYAGDEEKEELGKTLLLIRNKTTGKVRLVESGTIDLKPVLSLESEAAQLLETSHLELSRKFGSKKQKQRMETREKLKVNTETVAEQMQNVTQEISVDTLDISAYNKSNIDDFYIPPINRSAETIEGVYELNKILTAEQYEKIYSELEGKEYEAELLPFIKAIVTKIKSSPKLIVLAVYANCLFQLFNTIVKEICKKSFVISPHSVTLNNIVLSEFISVSNGRRTRPGPYKDKSLCHAIVFLLIANNYKIDLDNLCEASKLTPNVTSLKARVTGATIVASGSKKIVQLKLPLNTKSVLRRRSTKF